MTQCTSPRLLWEPTADQQERTRLHRYLAWLESEHKLVFDDYQELWAWSVTNLDEFWKSIWEFFAVDGSYTTVLGRRGMPGAEWFPGAEVSYVEHVFRDRNDDELAIIHASELTPNREVTWGDLRHLTTSIANGLRAHGVQRGDRVVAYMPNIPETVAAFLACGAIGAIWSACSPDFGPRSVLDRFAQIEPIVLLTVDGYRYGGSDFDRRDTVSMLRRNIPSLQETFVLPYLGREGNWDKLLMPGELGLERLPFVHPLWILYSSGTTGLPKAIVHSQGGILLEHLKTLYLHFDARPGDRLFWFTTTGWMMWNLLIGGLLTESAIVLYDGSPAMPDLSGLWDLAEQTGITCFGTSAAFISACSKAGVKPAKGRDLSCLRSVGSTGSPLSPESFRWVYEDVGEDVWLFSTSGGTDVCTAFVGGVPTLPVYEGELQGRSLGAKVEAFDDQGRSVVNRVGELVVTEPMPSMPVFFWDDPEGSRYRESYFEMYPGTWRHGDWIEITSRGTAIIYGRSDATINRGGVRIGTNEIYRAVLTLDEVADALVVDIPRKGSSNWMPLFVVLRGKAHLDDELVVAIKQRIRDDCSPRYVPDEVREIGEVPRTLSGKILELPVKRILMGQPVDQVASRDALANPHALDYFAELSRDLDLAAP